MKEVIAKLINKFRRDLKINQVELGKIMGVTGAAISYWESGKRTPKLKDYIKLVMYYNQAMRDKKNTQEWGIYKNLK